MNVIEHNGFKMYNDKDMVCKVINETGEFEPETTQWWLEQVYIANQTDGMVIDVGAYTGYYTIQALMRKCNCVSFEPNNHVYQRLLDNINLNLLPFNNQQREIGLSNKIATMSLGDTNRSSLTSASKIVKQGKYKVFVKPLDGYTFDKRIVAIKIDIEGHEIEALEGAVNSIIKDKPSIVTEALSDEEYNKQLYFFESIGYNCVRCIDKRNYLWQSSV